MGPEIMINNLARKPTAPACGFGREGSGRKEERLRDRILEIPQDCIPDDHCGQVVAEHYARAVLRKTGSSLRVLDLGCGAAGSLDFFRSLAPNSHWVGLDLGDSPEVRSRSRTDAEFHTFDGSTIPFDSQSFDLVFCKQVFEHVRRPAPLAKEIGRVLKPGGSFAGSTSHLEPYHSFSCQNFTPFGLCELLCESGLRLVEIRPGIDAFSLLLRRVLGAPKFMDRWFHRESPLNRLISCAGAGMRKSMRWRNQAKLLVCGHFCFLAGRDGDF